MPGREPLPINTTLDDLRAAIQAAWLSGDYKFVRDLVERYIEYESPYTICFRCAKTFRSVGLYEFRPLNGNVVRLCDECWRSIDRRAADLGPGTILGALIRDRYGDQDGLSMWVQTEASGQPGIEIKSQKR